MKHTITVTQLQRGLREITKGLVRGDDYILTSNGQPLAHILPIKEQHAKPRRQVDLGPGVTIGHKDDKPFRPLPKPPKDKEDYVV